jgi:DNA-binding winged helix-turn-helix (wHTH) protein
VAIVSGEPTKLRFGDVLFDLAARQIFRGTAEVHLSGKAFELLRFLIERRPDAVSKQDLQARLWPDTFVTEANLPSLVAEIRDALGDDARQPKYIATLHGFGYAFRGAAAPDVPPRMADCWLVGVDFEIRLGFGENTIGRDGLGGAQLDSPTVSRLHARIVVAGRSATIEDLGSKNGTFVNNAAVTAPRVLADADQIRIGSFLLTFRQTSSRTSTLTQSVDS